MKDRSLKNKAIQIKGKKYVLVADRLNFFNEVYENGAIETHAELRNVGNEEEAKWVFIVHATITPDIDKPTRKFTGSSQAVIGDGMVNKTAALENAETSAVGRALAMMGIGVIEGIASVDEINKAKTNEI